MLLVAPPLHELLRGMCHCTHWEWLALSEAQNGSLRMASWMSEGPLMDKTCAKRREF